MRILVTGGLGFIGRRLTTELARAGHTVTALDNGWRSELDAPSDVESVVADIRDPEAVGRAVAGKDGVVHLAAIQGTQNFYDSPGLVLDVNTRGTLNVAEACAREGVGRLVFASSSEVYGIPDQFPTPESARLVVPDPRNARWSYGASKIVGEVAVANIARRSGYQYTILRYHNVYGPRMGWDHVIPQFISRLERGEEFTVQGDGEQRRTFCFVDDAVAGTVAALLEPGAEDEIFNIGNPSEEVSINELVRLLERVSGKEIHPRYISFEGEGTRRRVPDVSRARDVLGFEPIVGIAEGLRLTYAWYSEAIR